MTPDQIERVATYLVRMHHQPAAVRDVAKTWFHPHDTTLVLIALARRATDKEETT